MSPRKASNLIRDFLTKNGLPFVRVSAQTVGFHDLARGDKVFVTVHGWQPSPKWEAVQVYAKTLGVIAQAR